MQGYNKISSGGIMKLAILLFSLILIPYVALCFYAHPVADDYNLANRASFWAMQWKLYLGWNGRYSSNFMAMLNPALYNSLFGYRLIAWFIIVFLQLSVYYVMSAFAGKAFSILQKILASTVCTVLILGLLPSLPEGIYWYSGSVTYMLGCIAAALYIGTIILYVREAFLINRFLHLCLCLILLIIANGFNEVQMFLLLFGHLLLLINSKKDVGIRSFLILLLLLCVLFSAIVFFSPGNHFREGYFPEAHRPVNSLLMTLAQMLRFFLKWISYIPLLLASIAFIPVSSELNKQSELFRKLGTYNPWIMFSLLWIILFLCVFPAYWATGILGQHRTLNTACFFFIPTWFLFLHSLFTKFNSAGKMENIVSPSLKTGLIFLTGVILLISGNCGTALMDFATGKISGYDREMNQRIDLIMEAKNKGEKEIMLPVLQNRPKSLFVLDIQPGCNDMPNQMQAHFFGLTKICVDSTQISNKQ